ncbi:MAG: 3-deoxy-D-manno-octulosonic acid transferase [Bacteroidetes bacterium]|nr:3-deoxy-D-manno-octulosonic acid transferase [Bacteroidota bacterium]
MKVIWFLLYNVLVVPSLYIGFRIAGLFNKKIKQGLEDRATLFANLKTSLKNIDTSKKMVWFHSASMGEFEQAKPIIEKLKSENDINVIVTFFSPSGYRNSLKYKHKDIISYIPFDSPRSVKKFIDLVNPVITVFMRYDYWPNLVWGLKKKNIPMFIVDATMRLDSKRKLPFSISFHKSLFKNFNRILAVSSEDVDNFKVYGVTNSQVKAVGDTRFDRVYQKSLQAKELHILRDGFFEGNKVIVLGSSWPSGEDVLLPALKNLLAEDPKLRVVLVPHEPTIDRLEKIEENLNGSVNHIRLSHRNNYTDEQIVIVDSIGVLVSLYYYADIAYIGGSFKQGIHNVLEAAVYGIPVFFGPKITNSQEALKLNELTCGTVIKTSDEVYTYLKDLLYDDEKRKRLGKIAYDYVNENIGATEQITKEVTTYLKQK